MLPIPVIASPVTHLTDARYFAAWLIDWVVYPLDGPMAIRPQKLMQIREWLEGPDAMARFEGTPLEDIREQIKRIDIDTVVLAGRQYLASPDNPLPNKVCLELSSSVQGLPNWPDNRQPEAVFFYRTQNEEDNRKFIDQWSARQVPLYLIYQGESPEQLIDLIKNGKVKGLVVQGGEEEKVGYKSFDQLDDLYDFLLDEWD